MTETPIEISVQADPHNAAEWVALARRCEQLGIRALLTADHTGASASPFVPLAAAASVTERLRLGTYVLNAGVRRPLDIAADAATLDLLSDGRVELGLGAGHTPTEWHAIGIERPDGPARVRHLIDPADAVRTLLSGGELAAGRFGALGPVRLLEPVPVQQPIPLLIGGTSRTAFTWAGAHANAVGLTGLGATRADGHRHDVNWDQDHLHRQIEAVHAGAATAGRTAPALEALVQVVQVTDDAGAAIQEIATQLDADPQLVQETPYVLIGTEREILTKIRTLRERWGITRWVVRENALTSIETLLTSL